MSQQDLEVGEFSETGTQDEQPQKNMEAEEITENGSTEQAGLAEAERQPRVRSLKPKALDIYWKAIDDHQKSLRSTWQDTYETLNDVAAVGGDRTAIDKARSRLCLTYGKHRLKAREYVDYLHANYTSDSIRLLTSFTQEDQKSDDIVTGMLRQLDERTEALSERCTRSSRYCNSHQSAKSNASSEARRARAKAEKARASREFLQKEALILKKQAELDEEQAHAHARAQRKRQELDVDLNLVKEEKVCAEAEAEAEVYEDFANLQGGSQSGNSNISLPKNAESSYERTRAYVASQSNVANPGVLQATAPPFLPKELFCNNYVPPVNQIPQNTPQVKDEAVPSLVNYLVRKELSSSRLTTFNDRPDTYISWKTTFRAVMKEASVSPAEELDLLVKWLGPTSSMYALSIRSSNGNNPDLGKRLLWDRLDERYGSPEIIEACLRAKMDKFPKVVENARMYELADVLTEILVLKDNPNYQPILAYYDSPIGVRAVVAKLPPRAQSKWSDRAFAYKRNNHVAFPPFSYFVSFVRDMALLMNDPGLVSYSDIGHSRRGVGTQQSQSNRGPGVNVKRTDIQKEMPVQTSERCLIHPDSRTHTLGDCREFLKKTLPERLKLVKDNSFCYKCCATDKHIVRDCKAEVKCLTCGSKKHITALHQPRDNSSGLNKRDKSSKAEGSRSGEALQEENSSKVEMLHGGEGLQTVNSKCTSVCGGRFQGRSCAKIVLVEVLSENQPGKAVATYALLDDQINRSLASSELLDSLEVTGEEIEYTLSSCSGKFKSTGRKAKGLVIRSSEGSNSFALPPLIECHDIPSDDSEIPTPEIIRHFSHLDEIITSIPEYRSDCSVGLLIGRDLPEVHHVQKQITGPRGTPFAQRTGLGWVVVGEVCLNKVHPPVGPVSISSFKTNVVNGRASIFTPCKHNICLKEDIQYDPLFNKTKDDEKPAWSVEDREFLELMNSECIQDKNGFWTAPLPFRDPGIKMPNNRAVALKRAMILDKSLKKDNLKRDHFVSFMQKVIDSGAAEVAPSPRGEVWYLPIFGVYNPKKPGKVRGVFDSSAEFKGTSLNQNLLSGPNLTNSLLAILLRFRKDTYAVSADVEQMFYRFLVKEEHRDYLRFLWYRDNNPHLDLIEYRMRAHAFGNSPSPAVAAFALRKAVEKADDDVQNFVRNDFYVDDALRSGPDAKELATLVKRTQAALQQNGNIRLHKVISNSVEVVKSFPVDDLGEKLKSLDVQEEGLPTQSSLGVSWNLASDTFQFHVQLPEHSETRREMLSTLNSIFDPIGFLSPFTIQGRILLRELTSGADWDAPLPITYQNKWSNWKTSLEKLKDTQIPRMFTPVSTSTANNVQLHVYCDASELAVAAVAYLQIYLDNCSHVGFVMGKAKLAPSKGHTIPRLELCAAVLAVEIGEFVCETLGTKDVRYHSDSRVVLGYINNRTRRFYTYVANRVERILRSSKPSQWSYVSTHDNPSDQATRSSATLEGFQQSTWLRGPKHLTKHDEAVYELVEPDKDREIRPAPAIISLKTDIQENLCAQFESFSRWEHLVNVVLLIKSAVQRFRKRKQVATESCDPTPPTKSESEGVVIGQVQQSAFAQEITCLQKDKTIPVCSPINNLDPYMDDKGILRVGGRLRSSGLSIKETNPIILPRKHHVSRLIVRYHHGRVHHQGRLITEGSIRNSGYWIIGAKRLVSSVISECLICRKLRGRLEHQKMADLPRDRLTPGPPFTSVGIDAFGPWSIVTRKTRGGSANSKRWAILFTCLTTRAIHIEVVEEMSSSSFINALRRFVALRGNVKEIRSDCGTNFVGAVNELGIKGNNVGDGPVTKYLNESDIIWRFNAPHSSHMGGVWERMIGLIRRILDAMLLSVSSKNLTHEVLTTFMAEVCAIVNSRPVASISSDPKSPEILSPAALLNQKFGYPDPMTALTFSQKDMYKAHWKQVQTLSEMFWKRWREGYLQNLQSRRKWRDDQREVKEGDVILLRDKSAPRCSWAMGIVQRTFKSDCDNIVRKAEVKIVKDGGTTLLTRPINEMVVLLQDI